MLWKRALNVRYTSCLTWYSDFAAQFTKEVRWLGMVLMEETLVGVSLWL